MLRGIHKLCEKGSWEDALSSLETDDSARVAAARVGGWGEWTPLHLACRRNAPLDLIVALLNAAPIAAETFDLRDRLPIHYATEHGASNDIFGALVESCPESITGVDNAGCTPLHLSFVHSEAGKDNERPFPSVEEVELLSDEVGTVASTADAEGFLPIHRAMNNVDNCSLDVVLTLICVDAQTLDMQNKDGLTPLHQALLNCSEKPISLDVVKALMGAAEEEKDLVTKHAILSTADNNGRLPLHCACQNFEQVPLEVLRELVMGYKDAACIPMNDGFLPLDILEDLRYTVSGPNELLDFNEKSDLLFMHNPNAGEFGNDPNRLGRLASRIRNELSANQSLSDESREAWKWMCCTLPNIQGEDNMSHLKFISMVLNSVNDAAVKKSLVSIKVVGEDNEELPLRACVSERVGALMKRCLLFADRYELVKENGRLACTKETTTSMSVKALDWEKGVCGHHPVIIKFMSERKDFLHEINLYAQVVSNLADGPNNPAVVPIIESFDVDRIGRDNEKPGDSIYARCISKDENLNDADLSRYPHAIVFEESGESLASSVRGNDAARTADSIKEYSLDAAHALWRLHSRGVIHGNIMAESYVMLDQRGFVFDNLQSASVVQLPAKGQSASSYVGDAESVFEGSLLLPQMIAKLDKAGLRQYSRYWKIVADDANIVSLLKNAATLSSVSESINSYLGEGDQANFTHLWNRMTRHGTLWTKIMPKEKNGFSYVIKTFWKDEDTGQPLSPDMLPYDLVPATTHHDIWSLGALIYEILTGEALLDFETEPTLALHGLFHWDHTEDFVQSKLVKISHDPVAKDLVTHLLNTSTTSPFTSMESVLQHPFFKLNGEESRRLCLEVMKKEKDRAIKNDRAAAKEKMLMNRTKQLERVSLKMQLRFESSTWALWGGKKEEATFPTSLVLLPYKLQKSRDGVMRVPKAKKDLSCHFGLALANLMHYAKLVSDIEMNCVRSNSKESHSTKLWEYTELNKKKLHGTEKNMVGMCRGIVTRTKNAEKVLCDILRIIAPGGDCAGDARKLVREAINDIVDLESCEVLARKAASAETALQSLMGTMGIKNGRGFSTEEVVSKQLEKLSGNEFGENDLKQKSDVETALFRLVKNYGDDPILESKNMLRKCIDDVQNLLFGPCAAEAYLYLIDDVTGRPVHSRIWPVEATSFSVETVKMLITSMYFSIKSVTAMNFPFNFASSLGVVQSDIPREWAPIGGWRVANASAESVTSGFDMMYNTMNDGSHLEQGKMLRKLHAFLVEQDPQEDFASLKKICSPHNEVLWTTNISDDEENKLVADDLRHHEEREIANLKATLGLIFGTAQDEAAEDPCSIAPIETSGSSVSAEGNSLHMGNARTSALVGNDDSVGELEQTDSRSTNSDNAGARTTPSPSSGQPRLEGTFRDSPNAEPVMEPKSLVAKPVVIVSVGSEESNQSESTKMSVYAAPDTPDNLCLKPTGSIDSFDESFEVPKHVTTDGSSEEECGVGNDDHDDNHDDDLTTSTWNSSPQMMPRTLSQQKKMIEASRQRPSLPFPPPPPPPATTGTTKEKMQTGSQRQAKKTSLTRLMVRPMPGGEGNKPRIFISPRRSKDNMTSSMHTHDEANQTPLTPLSESNDGEPQDISKENFSQNSSSPSVLGFQRRSNKKKIITPVKLLTPRGGGSETPEMSEDDMSQVSQKGSGKRKFKLKKFRPGL